MSSVLIVDDDPSLRHTLSAWTESFGYVARTAAHGDEALEAMRESASDIALCDVSIAARDGVWLAWRLREQYPHTAIVMATALRDAETAAASLRNDVADYLLKPFDRLRLYEALALARDWHAATAGDDALHQALQDRLRTRRAALAAALAEGRTTQPAALDGLMAMLQLHERDGRRHATRVARLTMALADLLGVGGNGTMLDLEYAALLHDIGKLEVPLAILTKSAPLDAREWEVMRTHPQLGYDLVRKLPPFAAVADLVLAHHESFDGGGYPRGLRGAQIPLGARILAVADAYDSMTHPHTQRPPLPAAFAMNEIERCSGSQFDPEVAEMLGKVLVDATKESVQ